MKSVKTLLHGLFATIALSAVAAPANACIVGPCPMFFLGLNGTHGSGHSAQQTAGLGPFGVSAGPFSFSLPGTSGHAGPFSWGLNAQQNAGFLAPFGFSLPGSSGHAGPFSWGLGPFGVSAGPFGFNLPGTSGNAGPFGWGMNAAQNAGFPGSNFGPFSWGLNPMQSAGFGPFGVSAGPYGFNLPGTSGNVGPFGWGINAQQNAGVGPFGGQVGWGINAQQNAGLFMPPLFGFGGQQAAQPQMYPVMVPYPVPAQQPQGSGVQPVQCSINQVPALTKSVDDCEKAGGDVPSATKTSALQEARK